MQISQNPLSLKQLLDACTSNDPGQLEQGWRELLSRYKIFIYKVIVHRATHQAHGNIHRIDEETVNDIFSEVIVALCEDDYKLLRRYKSVDCERSFRGYLATITARITGKHRSDNLTERIDDLEEQSRQVADESEHQVRLQFFEPVVNILRARTAKKEKNVEYKILMFNLYVLGDFSAKMLLWQPLFKGMGPRVLDNVINRTRGKFLQKDAVYLRENG
jgi:hypothetical protein